MKYIKKLLSVILSFAIVVTCVTVFQEHTEAAGAWFEGQKNTAYIYGIYGTIDDYDYVKNIEIDTTKSTGIANITKIEQSGDTIVVSLEAVSAGELYIKYEQYEGEWDDAELSYKILPVITPFKTRTIYLPNYVLTTDPSIVNGVKSIFVPEEFENVYSIKSVTDGGTKGIAIEINVFNKRSGYISLGYEYFDGTEWIKNTLDTDIFMFKISDLYLNDENDSQEFEQLYTLQADSISYTDVVKVKVEWNVEDINVTYTENRIWDPDDLEWIVLKNNVNVTGGKASFKLTNYSSVEVFGTATFNSETSLADTIDTEKIVSTNSGKVVGSVVNNDKTIDSTKKANPPSMTISVDLNDADDPALDYDELIELENTDSAQLYGKYTLNITGAVTIKFEGYFNSLEFSQEYVTVPVGSKVTLDTSTNTITVGDIVITVTNGDISGANVYHFYAPDDQMNFTNGFSVTENLILKIIDCI